MSRLHAFDLAGLGILTFLDFAPVEFATRLVDSNIGNKLSGALDDLLAELHAKAVLGMPGDGAEAEGGFAIEAQPEYVGQVHGAVEIHQGSILRDVAHRAAQVFGLHGMEYRGLHEGRTPGRTALFNDFMLTAHWRTRPRN